MTSQPSVNEIEPDHLSDESPGSPSITPVRRQDRGKDASWIRDFLAGVPWGVLSMVWKGRPIVNQNLFVYVEDEESLYFHTAHTGRTLDAVAEGGTATFCAAEMGRFLPARRAFGFSVEYAAVVVCGTIEPVDSVDAKRNALSRIMEKYAPHLGAEKDYHPVTDSEARRTGVHRLIIESWTGKEKVEDPDFSGAYRLPSLTPFARRSVQGARPCRPDSGFGGDFLRAGY